jgi:hypothetical protein
MAFRIVPYAAEHVPAVRAFNARMRQAGFGRFQFIETAPDPREPAPGISFRHFLALDAEGDVRGGYFIRVQPFLIRGNIHAVGHFTSPVSEGVYDRRYFAVGPQIINHALKTQPLLFAMGMGGMDRPLPRMLKGMGWHVLEVPFFFRVVSGNRFLRNIGPLRKNAWRRLFAETLAWTGLGPAGIYLAQRARANVSPGRTVQAEPIRDFGAWVDEVWSHNKTQYSFSAVRTSCYLRWLYPQTTVPFSGIKLMQAEVPVGWISLLDCKPQDRSHFGSLKVAAIVDGVAAQPFIPSLVASAVRVAEENGADLIFSNQLHQHWAEALRRNGFWTGPSNYLLALSRGLVRLLEPLSDVLPFIHFNRGDGDGVANLMDPN